MVLDFAENYKHQDEVQSAHWYHTNATVHPIVCFYNCPNCNKVMEESIVLISSEKLHDYHAVHAFMSTAVNHSKVKIPTISKIVRFSDGCGAQYKSKGPFLDVLLAEQEYGILVEHNFYGSRHGKVPSDGEIAVVQRQASHAVLRGSTVINNARDFFDCCNTNAAKVPNGQQCLHFERAFYYIDKINRDRGHSDLGIRTVKGTRQLHCVKGVGRGKLPQQISLVTVLLVVQVKRIVKMLSTLTNGRR